MLEIFAGIHCCDHYMITITANHPCGQVGRAVEQRQWEASMQCGGKRWWRESCDRKWVVVVERVV